MNKSSPDPGTPKKLTIQQKKSLTFSILALHIISFLLIPAWGQNLYNAIIIGFQWPWDFAQDFISAKEAVSGRTIYPANFSELMKKELQLPQGSQSFLPFNPHSPPTILVYIPFIFFSLTTSVAIWYLILVLSVVLTQILIFKGLELWPEKKFLIPLISFYLYWIPFHDSLRYVTISPVITALLVSTWFCTKRGKNILAGIALGVAAGIKIYPGLLILYFGLRKNRQVFLSSSGTVLLLVVCSFSYADISTYIHFFKLIRNDMNYWLPMTFNNTLKGSLSQFFLKSPMNTPIWDSPPMLSFFFYAIVLPITAFHFRTIWNFLKKPPEFPIWGRFTAFDIEFASLLVFLFLLSPIAWPHYLSNLYLPLFIFGVYYFQFLKKPAILQTLVLSGAFFLLVDSYWVLERSSSYFVETTLLAKVGRVPNFIGILIFYFLYMFHMKLALQDSTTNRVDS